MWRLLTKTGALFALGIFIGSFIPTPPVAIDTTSPLTGVEAHPFLSTLAVAYISTPSVRQTVVTESEINARFTGMLLHLKWLLKEGNRGGVSKEMFDKQVDSILDDINDSSDSGGGNDLPSTFVISESGDVTAGTWLSSVIADAYISDTLTIGASSVLADDLITPDSVLTTGQTDEYCLTYESTGDTWEWQTCGTVGSSFATTSINTSLKLANIVTDETGSGALVFANSPTLTGTLNADSASFTGNVSIGTTTSNAHYDLNIIKTSTVTSSYEGGALMDIIANPSANSTAYYVAHQFSSRSQPGNTFDIQELGGSSGYIEHAGTGTLGWGQGLISGVGNSSTGTITNASAINSFALNLNAGGTITNLKNIDISLYNAGTITNTYGLYIGDLTSGAQTNQAYSIYASDPNTRSYFAGNVGIGTTTSTAKLTINASGANTTPLVIRTNGSAGNYTPTNSGIFEYDASGREIFRIFASDPDVDNNYNSGNLYIGYQSGASQPSDNVSAGFSNTGVGYQALASSTTGYYNSAFGIGVLQSNTTGYSNTANGAYALYYNTTGFSNTASGVSALGSNTTGGINTANGQYALLSNSTGNLNTANGVSALLFNTTGSSNTASGVNAFRDNRTGSYNTALGMNAGYDINTATSTGANTVIGYNTGRGIVNGVNNTILGANVTGLSSTLSNNIIIADGAGNRRINVDSSGNVGIGTTTPWQELSVNGDMALTGRIYDSLASAGTSGMVLQTTGTATRWVATSTLGITGGSSLLTDGGANTYVTATGDNFSIGGSGGSARLNVYGDIDVATNTSGISFMGTRLIYASSTNNSVAIGTLAGSSLTSATTYNAAFGYEAGRNMSNTNADYMLMLGYQAGYSNTGDHTNIIGFGSGFSNSGDYTNIIGQSAGLANSGDYSNLIGAFAGRNNTGGFNNFIGHSVGFSNTGNYNNSIGYYTGYNNTGSYNDFVGYQAGRYVLSSTSVAIGAEALYGSHATTYFASNNVALGYRAGYASDDGASNNILIGYQAADNLTTGNNNIIIGHNIDNITATADNRLNIGNLIFGTGLDGTGTTIASGNVGIGTSTPAQKLQVIGNIRVGTAGGNGCLEDFAGALISGTCSSDEELKENITPIAREGRSYLEAMAALTPVTYTWNETAGELYSKDTDFENRGLIAQDVEAQFPELVTLNDEGYRQVNFSAFPFYIIEALKEVWQKIQGHDERLEQLEQQNDYLKERIENIEDELNIDAPTAQTPPAEEAGEDVLPAEEPPSDPLPEEVVAEPEEEPTYVLVPAAP